MFAASMKWTMTDNKKKLWQTSVALNQLQEAFSRKRKEKKEKKRKGAQQQPSDGSNYQNLYAMPTFRD